MCIMAEGDSREHEQSCRSIYAKRNWCQRKMCKTVARKNGIRLATDTGDVVGERSLDVIAGESEVVKGTKEIYPGLYVCGMAASAVSGTPRMGLIFGGMLMSGKKVAELIIEKLK